MPQRPDQPPMSADGILRVLPIIVGVMMSGLTFFALIVGSGILRQPAPGQNVKLDAVLLSLVAAVGAGGVIAFIVMTAAWPRTAAKVWSARTSEDQGKLRVAQALQTSTVMRAAFVEAPGLLACVLAMITGERALLALTALCLLLLASLLRARSTYDTTVARLAAGVN